MGLPNIGPLELIIILAVLLLIVGPRRLPEMGQAVGKTIREFRKASSDITDAATVAPDSTATAPLLSASTSPPPSASTTPTAGGSAAPAPNTLSDQATPNVTVQAPPDDAADPGMDRNDDATRLA
jgi:sec-independent protein translocase protein TatA